jgi:uncharacterized hydrophobic protein (TIGR00341 family)
VRLVEVMVPVGKRAAVVDALDDEGIDYVITDETSGRGYAAVVSFPLPTRAVEPVLDRLREAGVDDEAFTVVVEAETVVSRRFEALQERYEREEQNGDRIAREELIARADGLMPEWVTYVLMTAISAAVATAGLLLDSPAVVVGSMVIAPLIGPAMAASVGTVVDDPELFREGVRLQILGGLLAIAAAATFAAAVRYTRVVPLSPAEVFDVGEIRERLAPDVLSLAVALLAGGAGAMSVASGVSSALVGVMIAAALVPPTAVVGIGIAWQSPNAVVGSLVLVLVNLLSINLAALAVLWWQGYRPERLFRLPEARTATAKRVAVLSASILVLSAFLGAVTYTSYGEAGFEEDAADAVAATVEGYPSLELLSVEVRYDDQIPFRQPERVVVTVGHPIDSVPPPVADDVADRVNELDRATLGLTESRPVEVDVRYVPVDESGAGTD